MKRLIYILFIFAFLSCGKDGSVVNKGRVMEFSVHTPEVVSTKAEVTLDRLKTAADHILIYGMSSDGNSSVPVFPSPGTVSLVYNSNTNTWKPLLKRNNEEIEFLWDEAGKMYYQFYAYAFSGNVNADNNKLEISNEAAGRQFTVEQPETAVWQAPGNDGGLVDGSGTIDYLLSYLVSETSRNGSYSVVDLKLEHAMAKVEVDVQVAAAMLGRIKNVNVEIRGIKRGATMLCLQPKLEGEDGSNPWIVNMNKELSRASYKVENIVCSASNAYETDMSFIVIPVTKSEMDGYKLVLTYYNNGDVIANDPTYRCEFALKDFSPKGWMNGHRVRYVLTVDNSIHLEGSIVDYQNEGYMEGVMLPDIQ